MEKLSRRRFLQASGALAVGAGLAGCGGGSSSDSSGGGGGGGGPITWWDHQNQLEPAKKRIFEEFAASEGGMPVEYTYNNPERLGQTLQLAKQSDQLPDVHSNAGLNVHASQLIEEGGWLAPLNLNAEAMERLDGALIEGIHVYDGEVYSFPIFHFRVYTAVTWFNTKLVEQAGLDPQNPPTTYDEFRAAASAVQQANDGVYGWIWNIGMPPRLADQVNWLAQAAGFEGGRPVPGAADGMLFRTGEFAFHADEYLNVIEFLLSLQQDKLLVPGAESWLDDVARERWTAGLAGYYFDGPWCPGVALKNTPDFADSLGVGPILKPEAGAELRLYHMPQPGEYWLTPGSEYAEEANRLISDYFTTPEYSVDIANTMSQPPRDLEAVDQSDAHPEYKKLIGWFGDQVFLGPSPVMKNPEIIKVDLETKPVEPGLGQIIQGAFTGDVTDVRAALKKLSDDSTAERERAVKAAQDKGAEVSLDDWAFPDWEPGADYGLDA